MLEVISNKVDINCLKEYRDNFMAELVISSNLRPGQIGSPKNTNKGSSRTGNNTKLNTDLLTHPLLTVAQFAVSSEKTPLKKKAKCIMCGKAHASYDCMTFKTWRARKDALCDNDNFCNRCQEKNS